MAKALGTITYYCWLGEKDEIPTVPSTYPPENDDTIWGDIPPDGDSEKRVYYTVCTVYDDGTFVYSTPDVYEYTDVEAQPTKIGAPKRYWKVMSADTQAPAEPTSNPPSGWLTEEPETILSTQTLYSMVITTYDDGTWICSDIEIDDDNHDVVRNLQIEQTNVYWGAAQPTGGEYSDNDIWFDTKNGGIYIYRNGKWAAHKVGTVSIADGSVTADKILVTTALVNALFAKDITATGAITGAKLIGAILSGEAIDISSEGTSPDGAPINTRIYTVIDTETKGTTGVRIECRYGTTKQVAALDVSDGLVAVEGTFLAAGLASLYDLELGAPAQEKLLSYVRPVQKQLWSGTKQMTDTDTVTLSQKISAQNNGIILVFSVSSDGTAANNWGYQSFFISKWLVAAHSGVGHTFLMNSSISFDSVGSKYLYIADTTIKGHEKNTASGTGGNSGIKYNNSKFMLRYVYGI